MSKLIVKSGLVFDPLNNINGEVKDILIEDGKIVEKFSSTKNVNEIDAKNKTVIPAAIDIHTHIASQQVNWARLLGSKDKTFKKTWQEFTLNKIAIDYINNGYTFLLEANVFPSLSKQTIFDFQHLPVLDKAMLLNISNLWALELEYQRGKVEDIAIFLSDLLSKTYGFGLKVYNPFEAESWNFKELRKDLSQNGRLYNFSALDVYENLIKTNEYLNLPHSLHAHVEGYETEQAKINLSAILKKINSLEIQPKVNDRSQIIHLAHASSYSIDSDNSELIKSLNNSEKIDLDLGIICFDTINPMMTSDRWLINQEIKNYVNSNEKNYNLFRSAIEFEGDSFTSLRKIEKSNHFVNLWANAIDLALNIKNKWQIQLSLNYPNYGDINNIPKVATWLLSSEARVKFLEELVSKSLPEKFEENSDKTLTFNEFVIISRASPAKSLGIGKIKGNLGINADGDINILDVNINDIDLSKDYAILESELQNIEYVIKAGEIIKNKENIDLQPQGEIFWSNGKIEKQEGLDFLMSKKKEFYQKYYSYFYDTLKISIDNRFLRNIS